MNFDTEQQKQIFLEIFQKVTVSGDMLETFYHLKRAVLSATISPPAMAAKSELGEAISRWTPKSGEPHPLSAASD